MHDARVTDIRRRAEAQATRELLTPFLPVLVMIGLVSTLPAEPEGDVR